VTRLQRFVLRAKVTLQLSDWRVRAFRGAGAVSAVGEGAGRATPAWGSPDEVDVVAPLTDQPNIGVNTEIGHIDALRVDSVWPRMGVDILVGDIPGTSGVLSAAVSFTKGCYPGQELVERMDSRGTAAPVVVRSLPIDGLGVGSRLSEDSKDVGTVTSVGITKALARVARGASVGEPLR
jgi:folate-binding protein YgfZ